MTGRTKLRIGITRHSETIYVRARKGGQPLTQEDRTQLQTLEYEIANTDHFCDIEEGREIFV